MDSFDQEVIDHTIRSKGKIWWKCQGWSFWNNINKDIGISNVRERDMPF
jgi:hypothetical protein